MLTTRLIDGLTVFRTDSRDIELRGGTEAERTQVLSDLQAVLTGQPHTRTFRLALGRAELMTRRAGMVIGLSRDNEALLRGKLESATDASLAEVRSNASKTWR